MTNDLSKAIIWFTMSDLMRVSNLTEGTLKTYQGTGKLYKTIFMGKKDRLEPLYGLPLATLAWILNTEGTFYGSKFFIEPQGNDVVHLLPSTHIKPDLSLPKVHIPGTGMEHTQVVGSRDFYHATSKVFKFQTNQISLFVENIPVAFVRDNLDLMFGVKETSHATSDQFMATKVSPDPTPLVVPEDAPDVLRAFLKKVILASSIESIREEAYNLLHPDA